MDDDYARWFKDNPAPDLQAMVRLAGERYACSIGLPYDPTKFGARWLAAHHPRRMARL
jgi:hypothetical protein